MDVLGHLLLLCSLRRVHYIVALLELRLVKRTAERLRVKHVARLNLLVFEGNLLKTNLLVEAPHLLLVFLLLEVVVFQLLQQAVLGRLSLFVQLAVRLLGLRPNRKNLPDREILLLLLHFNALHKLLVFLR